MRDSSSLWGKCCMNRQDQKCSIAADGWFYLQIQHLLSGVVDEVAGEGSGCGAVRQDDGVFGVLAPLDEEFSGEAGLKVWLAAKHHLGAGDSSQVCQTVAQVQVTELERVISLVFKTPHELVTHPFHLQEDNRLTIITGEIEQL